ncbi:MAG: ThiF family adenylyltransferase [Nitrospinota bacterium]
MIETKKVEPTHPLEDGLTDRQERLEGFRQEALRRLKVVLVGAGGLGGEIGEGLARKGVGELTILDGDRVTLSNLNRQHFYARDLYQNKAKRLAANLKREALCGSRIAGHPLPFEEALETGIDLACDVAVIGVDSNPCRAAAARHFYAKGVPAVFTAVSMTANNGYVFVQEPGGACIGCLFPDALNDEKTPCPGVPAVKDILKVMAGVVLYAVDSLVMERPRAWNYRDLFLDGSAPDRIMNIPRGAGCPLCRDLTPWTV